MRILRYSLFNDLVIKPIKYVNVLFGNSESCVYFELWCILKNDTYDK